MTGRARTILPLLVGALILLCVPASASARYPVAKDGRIHACFKAKGKRKGTLRVVRNAKVRCPRRWRKVAWRASGLPGPQGEQGPRGDSGATGATGAAGAQGAPGRNENVVVDELEDKVTELLTKVQGLEAILGGVTNQQLQEAIAAVPVVGELCGQAKALTEKTGELGTALGGLGTILDTLTILALPSIPSALEPFECQ
ncbi:MAG TPA: hypothetical protein VFK14_07300 [Solirubrobacterales bacterium]|nr:hypothetical protein [Solirubrobacterales bacterium]